MKSLQTTALATILLAGSVGLGYAQSSSSTVGTGGTSATTLGTGGASIDADGDYAASIGSGGSAAAVDGKTDSRTKSKVHKDKLHGQSRASAQDGGTFSKSRTQTKIHGDDLSSKTLTMSHERGQKPVIETSPSKTTLGD
ncbi:hypothetical protein LQ948_07565 [Jiella sp. MQZ9-1]|uniref:Uncharacterized protein n=1 Tax=Jiella flava TaxID=2816857 RepID=A0A939FZZ7_9HYPH|nr:hypothetical protein [Jiella flava]MBO0662642.1 hypothetical protein [Jiella flava]MCD2471064.1 hypothetical protein [Jiella flava]